MTEQTLEQEFAARIRRDVRFRALMSDPGLAVELFKEYAPLIPKGILQWATARYGPVIAKKIELQTLKFWVFSTEFQFENSSAFFDVLSARQLSDENTMDNADWDVSSEIVYGAVLNSASRTSDKEVHSALADLLLRVFSTKDRDSLLVSSSEDCALAISKLSQRHLKDLALYTAVSAVIPAEIEDYRSSGSADTATFRLDSLINPLNIELLSRQDRERMSELGVLQHSIHFRKPVDKMVTAIMVDKELTRKSTWRRNIFGINPSNARSDASKRFWSSSRGEVLKDDLFIDYSPTTTGKLIGFLVLKQLSNYDGPFYGFEE